MDARERFGNARPADEAELKAAGIIGGDAGAFFGFFSGQYCRYPSDGSIALIAGARSGKSSCFYAMQELENHHGCNSISFDTRSELATLGMLATSLQGYNQWTFNPLGKSGLPQHTLNIFDDLTPDNPYLVANVTKRINDFLPHTDGKKWWHDDGNMIVKNFCLAIIERDGYVSLPSLYRELMNVSGNPPAWEIFSAVMQRSQYPEVRDCVHTLMDAQNNNTGDGFRAPQAAIKNAFDFMQYPEIANAVGGNDFSLSVVCDQSQKAKVKIIIPKDYIQSCKGLIRAIFGYVIQQKIKRDGFYIAVNIDEASQLGYFPSIIDMYSYAGDSIIGACAWQEVGFILDAFGQNGTDAILGSAPVQVYAGVRTARSAEMVSSLGGITTHNYIDLETSARAEFGRQQAVLRLIQNGDLSEAAEAFAHYRHMAQTPQQVRGENLPINTVLNRKGMIAFAPGLVGGVILGEWTPYYQRPELAGKYLGVPQHGLDAVTITTRTGREERCRVITETCPPALAHLPQYQSGQWQYVEGFRPQGLDRIAKQLPALPSLSTCAQPYEPTPPRSRSTWGRERF